VAVAISKWRTLEDVRSQQGVIGPNAVLQLLPVIERIGGEERVSQMLARAGIFQMPSDEMIPEAYAARLHQLLRSEEPEMAPRLAAEAGRKTANYILANRIPKPAQTIMRALPPELAARGLSIAISKNAWTFAGSGTFRKISPWAFEIKDNPVIRGEVSDVPLCTWHAAVFGRLYRALVHPRCVCTETHCGAQPGHDACLFEITMER